MGAEESSIIFHMYTTCKILKKIPSSLVVMKATAVASPNMALVKYWGKRNDKLILPYNSSLSMTLGGFLTKTTVEFGDYKNDTIIINDEQLKKDEKDIAGHLERIRNMAGIKEKAKVVSESNFPISSGLASSASGLAALTLAATKAAGLNFKERELTVLTRIGSGSACRSICEGFVEWYKGHKEDGSDSYAETIAKKNHWQEFTIITAVVTEAKKKVGSRAGMAQSVTTCPFYTNWIKTAEEDLNIIKKGILNKNFTTVGSYAENNCLKMHSVMMTTKPPLIYWLPTTLDIIRNVMIWRDEGLESYFTIDAGQHVNIICLDKDIKKIEKNILEIPGVTKTTVSKPGDGAKIVNDHLF